MNPYLKMISGCFLVSLAIAVIFGGITSYVNDENQKRYKKTVTCSVEITYRTSTKEVISQKVGECHE